MVERLRGPQGLSANALSREIGIGQPTLSRWLRDASRVASKERSEQMSPAKKRPSDWTAAEKLRAVSEAASIDEAELGEWLRLKGLKEEHLKQWRMLALAGIEARLPKNATAEQKRIFELERELQRKDKALAETAALLVLRGKVEALLGEEDDSTRPKSEEKSSNVWRKHRPRGRR
jgi:transcriptional regulator with XRE-family HTH domain